MLRVVPVALLAGLLLTLAGGCNRSTPASSSSSPAQTGLTNQAPDLSLYKQVELGMSYDQVRAIAGFDGEDVKQTRDMVFIWQKNNTNLIGIMENGKLKIEGWSSYSQGTSGRCPLQGGVLLHCPQNWQQSGMG